MSREEFPQELLRFLPLDPPAYLQSFWQRALLFGLGPVDELSCKTYLVSRLKHLYKEIGKHSHFFLVTSSRIHQFHTDYSEGKSKIWSLYLL